MNRLKDFRLLNWTRRTPPLDFHRGLASAGVVLWRHLHLAAHPASVRRRSGPGGPGSGPELGGGSDAAERAAGQPGHLPHPGPDGHRHGTDPVADLPGDLQSPPRPPTRSAGIPTVKKLPANSHRAFFVVGSGRPVTPGTPVAPGTGPGPAVDLSPSPDPPPGPDGPGQPAQPPDGHGELRVAVWGSVRARGGHKQSSW